MYLVSAFASKLTFLDYFQTKFPDQIQSSESSLIK